MFWVSNFVTDPEAEIRRLRVKLIETEALVGEKEAEVCKAT